MEAASLVSTFGQEAGIALSLGESGTAALAFEQGPTLNLEHDATQDVLHCYVLIGAEPADAVRRAGLHRELLAANAYGHDTAGATLGVDDTTGEIVLSQRIDLDRADAALLRQVVEAMVPVAVFWQERLAGTAAQAVAPVAPVNPLMDFGLRA